MSSEQDGNVTAPEGGETDVGGKPIKITIVRRGKLARDHTRSGLLQGLFPPLGISYLEPSFSESMRDK